MHSMVDMVSDRWNGWCTRLESGGLFKFGLLWEGLDFDGDGRGEVDVLDVGVEHSEQYEGLLSGTHVDLLLALALEGFFEFVVLAEQLSG